MEEQDPEHPEEHFPEQVEVHPLAQVAPQELLHPPALPLHPEPQEPEHPPHPLLHPEPQEPEHPPQ